MAHLSLVFNQVELLHSDTLAVDPARLSLDAQYHDAVSANLRRMLSGDPHVRILGLVDAQGVPLVSSETAPPSSGAIADRSYFQTALSSPDDRLVLSEPLTGRWSGARSVVAARARTYPDGQRRVAIAVLDLSVYGGVIAALNLPSSWAFALWRDDGVLLHRLPATDHLLGRQMLADPATRALRMDPLGQVIQDQSPIDGSTRLVAAQKLPFFPLSVVTAVEQSWIDAAADANRRPTDTAVAALLLVGTLFFAALLRILRNDEQLLAATRREAIAARRDDAAKSAFLAHISHHIRTPLHTMVGFIDLMTFQRCADCPTSAQGYLHHARTAGDRMTYVVDRLMDFATIDGLGGAAARARFFPEPLVRAALAAAANDDERRVELQVAPNYGSLLGDPALTGRILDALLSNAARHAASRFGVELTRDGHRQILRVWDDGPGFPPDWTSQGPLSLEAVYGHDGDMGMGLPIVRRLAETMGWILVLGCAPEGGAEVRLMIDTQA